MLLMSLRREGRHFGKLLQCSSTPQTKGHSMKTTRLLLVTSLLALFAANALADATTFDQVESPRGTSPRGAHGTGRERLRSSGSSH